MNILCGAIETKEYTFEVKPIEALAVSQGASGGSDSSSGSDVGSVWAGDVELEEFVNGDYNIEDIIYNRIPLLDVNVFTDTPGGQTVPDDSIVAILRNIVATWYISFRNLATIALALILLYIGIRIAISTIPEKTGQYKSALISWVISLALLWFIHYFLIIVLNINDYLVSLFEGSNTEENTIYETIRTRAWDPRMYIGIPATIMFLVLIVYFYRFLWVYIKRYFAVMILIIIAPFICAKYAFDGAKGKRGSSLSNWMYDFTMNVLLQTVHALVYTVLMSLAVELAVTNVWGFILALVFIHFILKADKIFFQIFNFNRASNLEDVDKGFSKDDIAGLLFAGYFTKRTLKFGWNSTKKLARTCRHVGSALYTSGLRAVYRGDAENQRSRIRNARINALNWKDDVINSIYRGVTGSDSEKRTLKKLARKEGTIGRNARAVLDARKERRNKRYKANIKTATTIPLSLLGMAASIPGFVVSPKAGYAMFNRALKSYRSLAKPKSKIPGVRNRKFTGLGRIAQVATLGGYGVITNINEDRKDNIKKKGQISKAIQFIGEIDEQYDTAQTQWDAVTQAMNEDDKTKLMEVMKVAVVDGSTSNIKTNVYKHLRDSGEQEVTIGNIDQIVEDIARDTGMRDHVTDAQFDEIKDRVRTTHNYTERSYVEQVKNVADEIHRNFIEVKFDGDPAIDVVNTMDEIEGINQRAKKEAKRKVTDVERLITDLRVRE